jgi:hypothetical protein
MRFKVSLLLIVFSTLLHAQIKNLSKMTVDDADEHFKHQNYLMAIPIYRNELKKFPDQDGIRFKLAQCLLNTRVNREEAIPLLERVVKNSPKDAEAWQELGRAYHLTNRLDKAENAYKKFLDLKPKKEEEVRNKLLQIANARNAIANPVNVTFYNLGPEINSDEPDYYPFVSADETFMAFTSRRKDNIGGKKVEMDGYRSSDIYFSKLESGKWAKAQNAGKLINGAFDEQVVGMKKDASELIIYIDHIDKYGDLYSTNRKGSDGDYQKYKALDPIINEKIETTGSFNEDGTVFFFSRRDKMEGKNDLYMCRKLPTGKWSLALKLPDIINTPFNEDFPFFVEDQFTLYFASEGHNSMGGYDLFKSNWNPEDNSFTKPENLGFPLNTTDDDRSICVTPDNRVAYVSSFRPGGYGDLDIYRVKFNDNEQIVRIFTGKVFFEDTIPANQPSDCIATIIAINKETHDEYTFVPHIKTGKYVISLPAGAYSLIVSSEEYKNYREEMVISDIGLIELEKNKNFVLKKKNVK